MSEGFDDIEFIEEPFLTEEGFVNEACINALNKAIKNTPRPYERFFNDPEWKVKRCTFKKEITGAFVKWAVRQSSYPCPGEVENVVSYLDKCLDNMVKWSQFGFADLNLCDINKLLYEILYEQNISFFDNWGEAKKDYRKTEYDTMGEAEKIDPDYGSIDLDALLCNVCLDIRTGRRESDRFEKEWRKKNHHEKNNNNRF